MSHNFSFQQTLFLVVNYELWETSISILILNQIKGRDQIDWSKCLRTTNNRSSRDQYQSILLIYFMRESWPKKKKKMITRERKAYVHTPQWNKHKNVLQLRYVLLMSTHPMAYFMYKQIVKSILGPLFYTTLHLRNRGGKILDIAQEYS